jgi:lipoate-protein ligase A
MRYCEETLSTVEEDLALDEALLIQADAGEGSSTLRLWEPRGYAVVLGASRRLREDVRVENCEADGVPVARRSSGGGTVVIGPGTINATVVLRDDAAPGLEAVDTAQRFVLDRFAASLRAAVDPGIEVLGLGDFAVAGRKFAGSAQRRLKRWFLVHLTILHDFPLDRISRYLGQPGRAPGYRRGRSHEDFLMNLGAGRKIVLDSLRRAWMPPSWDAPTASAPRELVRDLVRAKYSNRAWIERF